MEGATVKEKGSISLSFLIDASHDCDHMRVARLVLSSSRLIDGSVMIMFTRRRRSDIILIELVALLYGDVHVQAGVVSPVVIDDTASVVCVCALSFKVGMIVRRRKRETMKHFSMISNETDR